jgi:ankyrin repeat protein
MAASFDDYESALEAGNAAALQRMASADAGRLPANEYGLNPLHFAVSRRHEKNQAATVRALLAGGAAVDARTLDGRTPLHLATAVAVPILLAAGADPAARSTDGNVPLHLNPQPELLGPGVDVLNSYGMTPLHFAALDGDDEAAQWLLAQGANPAIATRRTYRYKVGGLSDEFETIIVFEAGWRPYDFADLMHDRTKWSIASHRSVYERLDAATPRRSLLRR